MVLDRKTAVAALAIAVIALSQWPVVDSSPLQLVIYVCGGLLVIALGLSERARTSRIVMGLLGVLFIAQGLYEIVSSTTRVGLGVGILYCGIGATVALYQSGYAPWGTPNEHSPQRR